MRNYKYNVYATYESPHIIISFAQWKYGVCWRCDRFSIRVFAQIEQSGPFYADH